MKFNKNLIFWVLIASGVFFIIESFNSKQDKNTDEIAYSKLINDNISSEIKSVKIEKDIITGEYKNGKKFKTFAPYDPTLVPQLIEQKVTVVSVPRESGFSFGGMLLSWLPFLIIILLWFFMFRASSGGAKAFGMGKSKAKILDKSKNKIRFKDVAGIDEAKDDLMEIVDFLKNPTRYKRLGAKIPKGVLLVGPPGTGKTLTAKAVAGESEVPFYSISGSDFVEMFVGVGAARVRDMFTEAKKNTPCIIFIDELDAVGRQRGSGVGGGNDEREQTLNQLLVEMDGFEDTESNIIVIAATNRPDVLDKALLRPGRFDRQVVVPNPDLESRKKIIAVHIKKIAIDKTISIDSIAKSTPGFSGADLANLLNESALIAARNNHTLVTQNDIEFARDKIMMGSERRSLGMSEHEKKITAYHEAGHALTAALAEHSDPIHKATIVPRGRSLGMVMRVPEKDEISMSLAKIKDNLVVAIAGRIAEELIFGEDFITTGASNDILQMTNIARAMVTEWGYSEKIGHVRLTNKEQEIFMGNSMSTGGEEPCSQQTAYIVDQEIKSIVDEATTNCREIMSKNINLLHDIANALIEVETLSGKQIGLIIKGEPYKENETEEKEANDIKTSSDIPSVEEE